MKRKGKRTLTPKLRFPEFRDKPGWEEKTGDSLFDQINDRNPVPGLPVLAITQEHGAIPRDMIDYHVSVTKKSIESYKVVQVGDFIISLRSFQGGIEDSQYHGICSPAYVILRRRTGGSDAYFKHYLKTDRFIRVLTRNLEGLRDGKMISYKQFSELLLPVPSPPEQQKIAECLSSLDGLIAAEGRMLKALKAHKKGLMQQLFPQPGQTQPRLRFPEFRGKGEWREENLSRHIKLVSGVHLSPSDYSDHGQIPYFTGPSDFTNAESHVSKWTTQTDNKGVAHDILITVKGSGVGELWYVELPQAALGRQLMAVRPSNGINRFYFQLLLSKRRHFEDLAMGNLIPGLSRGDILNLKTPLPREAEQHRIADCLTSLDTRITAQAAKIESLKQHKRGLMQQLFPTPEEQ